MRREHTDDLLQELYILRAEHDCEHADGSSQGLGILRAEHDCEHADGSSQGLGILRAVPIFIPPLALPLQKHHSKIKERFYRC